MPKREDHNARLNKVKGLLTDRIVERVEMLEGGMATPLGHFGKMTKTERHQLLAQLEESQGWGAVLDEEMKKAGITDQGLPKNVIDFARQTMREMQEGLEDA